MPKYALMGFRNQGDGNYFAALAPDRGSVLHGEEAVEISCPKSVYCATTAEQEAWARREIATRKMG